MMDKTFEPAAIEARIRDLWEKTEAFKAGQPSRKRGQALFDDDPAAQRDGVAAHRPCAQQHVAGRAVPVRADARARCALAARHGPCRASRPRWWSSASWRSARSPTAGRWGVRPSSSASGPGRRNRAARSSASCSASGHPATGRAPASPWTKGSARQWCEAFVTLHKDGLIYRDKRLVNWDPKLLTAISDLEVVPVETRGISGTSATRSRARAERFITVATTRPETMLGDTAVAVHPEDERYKDLVGRNAVLPLVGRRIPIVADTYSDPEKGTGAVKITPAHDFNDFDVGRRHHLPHDQCLRQGSAPGAARQRGFSGRRRTSRTSEEDQVLDLDGLDRFAARDQDRGPDGGAGTAGEGRAARPCGAARRSLQRGHRAVADRPMVRRCRRRWPGRRWRRCGAAKPPSSHAAGRRPISTGWRTSSPGAFRASSGGGIAFRPGTGRTGMSSSSPTRPRPRPRPRSITARTLRCAATKTSSTPGSRPDSGPSRPWAGRSTTPELDRLLPDLGAGHRVRHHLLLGRPHDDAGPAFHERGTVQGRLHPCARSRREGRQDVEVEGQRGRSLATDRPVRSGCPALHPGRHGGPRA